MELATLLNTDTRQGPPTKFHPWHLLAAFHVFCKSVFPIGRYQLGSNLELGGGSIRSLIRFLRKRGLIEAVHRQGHQLSSQGKRHCETLKQVLIKLVELPQSSYTIDIYNYGCHLHQLAHLITDGIEQRDAAMRAGASGATTFIQDPDSDTIIMAKDHRIKKDDLAIILDYFDVDTGDVIIIGSGSSKICARLGTFAAIFTLLIRYAED
jgi:hypothetical protein